MQYAALTQLPELTAYADRTQAMLGGLIDDLETMPAASVQFRLEALGKVTGYIYKLTAVCKTLIALRASKRRNTDSIQSISATVRQLHAQMLNLKTRVSTVSGTPPPTSAATNPTGSAACPELACGELVEPVEGAPLVSPPNPNRALRFAPKRPPYIEDLIPAARLPRTLSNGSAGAPAGRSGDAPSPHPVHPVHNVHPTPASDPSDQSDQSVLSDSSAKSDSSDSPIRNSPDPQPSTPDPLQKLINSIESRIPDSIKNPDFQLPRQSDKAADFAPFLKLDLLPLTHTIPLYPLASPALPNRIENQ